ncbi:hypothetical protein DSO57_1011763 [Entomophthora muscae]|uniref:Uncharacterized protein n=1 Tax=Entomophthora muscae TaxID=34485 RepID=A0ACC2SVS8_9FUNG|nr:hypothetical protein DSO57_1011763 [Entomophthora muscae]
MRKPGFFPLVTNFPPFKLKFKGYQTLPPISNNIPNLLSTTATKMADRYKDMGSQVSKFTKTLDKKFKLDIGLACDPKVFQGQNDILRKIIIQHFIRQGQFELARVFSEEAEIHFPEELKRQFEGLHCIVSQIRRRNLIPAIEWAQQHRETLDKNGSNLEFSLHKLHYLHLLSNHSPMTALDYSRSNLSPFLEKHLPDIRRLLGLLIYSNRKDPAQTPYSDLLCSSFWDDIQHMFTRDFCSVLGLSHESPLYASVTVGTSALPTLIKMTVVMKNSGNEWSQSHELPVEIELVDAMRFHSIFVCPVSKEQASETNPPMMMPCGHVICHESLTKLVKGSSRFKCPYCPSESSPSQAVHIRF